MIRLLCVFFLALLSVVALNFYVDPAHLIKSGALGSDEFKIARILLDGKQAVVPKERIGFDERLTRRIFFARKKKSDSSVIFGSSRVRYFSGAAFNESNHFVDATNTATLEDLLVFTYLREQSHLLPKQLVISLDPWMIEKANSYTSGVQLSYPDAFTQAVDHYGVTLPEGSQLIYNNESVNMTKTLSVPFKSSPIDTSCTGKYQTFQEVAAGVSRLSGNVQISFDGLIEPGTYYWAWRVLVNGSVVGSGNYMNNLQRSPSPHEFRTMVTQPFTVKEGDAVSLEMAHATGDGDPVLKGLQHYKFRNLAMDIKCGDAAAARFKGWTDCDGLLARETVRKLLVIGKEMLSPAYFLQSLKALTEQLAGAAIIAKKGCTPEENEDSWVVCEDGSLPWPVPEKYDSSKVESIVRTTDDGLVPLKEVDEKSLELLKQITEHYRKLGTTVQYLLVPVHPFSYSKWVAENDSRGFVKAERVFRDFAKANGVSIAGSYDPNVIGCKNTDFRDWVHPLPRCANLLARELVQQAGHGRL